MSEGFEAVFNSDDSDSTVDDSWFNEMLESQLNQNQDSQDLENAPAEPAPDTQLLFESQWRCEEDHQPVATPARAGATTGGGAEGKCALVEVDDSPLKPDLNEDEKAARARLLRMQLRQLDLEIETCVERPGLYKLKLFFVNGATNPILIVNNVLA